VAVDPDSDIFKYGFVGSVHFDWVNRSALLVVGPESLAGGELWVTPVTWPMALPTCRDVSWTIARSWSILEYGLLWSSFTLSTSHEAELPQSEAASQWFTILRDKSHGLMAFSMLSMIPRTRLGVSSWAFSKEQLPSPAPNKPATLGLGDHGSSSL